MGYLTYIVLFIVAALSYDTISARRLLKMGENGRIVGGTEVPIEQFPYMAYLFLYNGSDYFECGGSIISRRYILTAAHCLEEYVSCIFCYMVNVTARIGSASSMSGGMTYGSTWLFEHDLYNPDNFDYDVALIRVPRMDLDGANATSVPLVRGGRVIPPDTNVNVTGWGATSEGGSGNGMLMGTTVPTISNPYCQDIFGEETVTERMFCAGLKEGGRDACQGDSGGPAVSNGRQIGIVSSGFGCADPYSPGFYTNITNRAIRRWIRRNSGV